MRSKQHPEHRSQCAVIQWARCYPVFRNLHALPNAALRTARGGAWMKAEGLLPGMPDLCLPLARNGFGSLYIEMKTPKGTLSQNQKERHAALSGDGNRVVVCRSAEEAITELARYVGMELPF